MNAAFEHIEEARYLLARIFESGFFSAGNLSMELEKIAADAMELGMTGGAALLKDMASNITCFAAGADSLSDLTRAFCNAHLYYTMVADMLVLETMRETITGSCNDEST